MFAKRLKLQLESNLGGKFESWQNPKEKQEKETKLYLNKNDVKSFHLDREYMDSFEYFEYLDQIIWIKLSGSNYLDQIICIKLSGSIYQDQFIRI